MVEMIIAWKGEHAQMRPPCSLKRQTQKQERDLSGIFLEPFADPSPYSQIRDSIPQNRRWGSALSDDCLYTPPKL